MQILYVDSCPHVEPARAAVERIAEELGVELDVELVEVVDAQAAAGLRFAGSPTVRVDGRDVRPRDVGGGELAFACRVDGVPDDESIRSALERAA